MVKRLSLSSPVLVGRSNELGALSKTLDEVLRGNGQTLFVSGEAGSGKTRLVNEFVTIARKKEINILSGWCLSNAGVPYFPFIEAFSAVFPGIEELIPAMPSISSQIGGLMPFQGSGYGQEQRSPQVWMDLTFSSVTKELLSLSSKKPVILVLEDIHWADSASLALLHYISRFVYSERILVLATFRNEGLSHDLEGHPSSLIETLRAMGREDLYQEIKLPSLSSHEVGLLASSMLGGQIQPTFLENLSIESHGNALFIVESLRTLMSEGCLIQENGEWRPSSERLKIPSKVKDLILQRISGLKLKQRKILDVASILGEKFDYRLIASVLHQEQIQVLEKLNSIAQTTLLVKFRDNSYSFDHAKSREIIYDELPVPLKTGYHMMIAERLETLSKIDKKSVVNDLAYHYEKAGNSSKTLVYSLMAGKAALAKFSNLEAKKYFSHVLDIAGEKEEYYDDRTSAIEGLGDAFFATDEFREALNKFQQLVNITNTEGVKLRAIRKAMVSARFLGNFDLSLELSKEAENLKSANSLEYARVLLNKGAAMGSYGNPKEALVYLEKAIIAFEDANSLPDLAQGLNESCSLYQTEGYPQKAVAIAKRAITINEEIGDLRGQVDAYFYAGLVFFNYRLFEEAFASFDKSFKIAEKISYNNRASWAALYSAEALDILGKLNSAITQNLLALKYAEKTDSHYSQSQSWASLLALYSKLGDIENADRCYAKIKQSFPDESKAGSKLGHAAMVKAEALFFAAKKDWVKSNQLFERSFDLLKGALFAKPFEATMRMDYALTLEKKGNVYGASIQREKAMNLTEKIDCQFREFGVETALLVKKENVVGEQIDFRLDFVNVSRMNGFLVRLDNVVPPNFNVCKLPHGYVLTKESLELKKQIIEPFETITIKFSLKASKPGNYILSPELFFEDQVKNIGAHRLQQLIIKIHPASEKKDNQNIQPIQVLFGEKPFLVSTALPVEFEFKSEHSSKVFDFLSGSFVEDYMQLRLSIEKSGWRTMMDAVKHAKVPSSAVYGREGRLGKPISELRHRGLIETRFFPGERGRGGNIMKLRICYEKEPVKRHIDQKVARNKN
jgi:tetratricopeptide (TPR) repeat protein